MKKTKIICFANNKGGSGKSTTCSNVGYGLRELGYKVLLIDGDMQLNLSLSLFDEDQVLAFAQSEKNLYEGLKRQDDLSDYIVHSAYEGLDLIPSSTLMSSIEYELFTKWQREFILRKCLTQIKESGAYDYILIDAPPTLGGWVMNILCASDEIIIPVDDAYNAFIANEILDETHFGAADAKAVEKTVYEIFTNRKASVIQEILAEHTGSETGRNCDHEGGYQKELFQTDIGDFKESGRCARI